MHRSLVALALLVAACDGLSPANAPTPDELAGTFVLQSVDDRVLPAKLTGSGGCGTTISDGRMELMPATDRHISSFWWEVTAASACPDSGGDGDFGTWSLGRQLRFTSEVKGWGPYSGDATRGIMGSGATVALHAPSGHTYGFLHVRPLTFPTGYLAVSSVDQTGGCVVGTIFLFRAPDGLEDGGTIVCGGQPPLTAGGPVGTWTVTVQPPAGYSVKSPNPNPTQVTVTEGQTTHVAAVLEKL